MIGAPIVYEDRYIIVKQFFDMDRGMQFQAFRRRRAGCSNVYDTQQKAIEALRGRPVPA